MDNAKCHSRLSEKMPTMNLKKTKQQNNMISFMTKQIEISSPLPVNPVLLEKICEGNITKKYIIGELATAAGYSVLCLPPYHCVFDPIEMNIRVVCRDIQYFITKTNNKKKLMNKQTKKQQQKNNE